MKITVDSKESANNKKAFQIMLNAEIANLPEGDIIVEDEKTKKVWTFERKTWSDAYNSWSSKRIQHQISRMVENCDNYILLIEGSPKSIYGKPDSIKGLQTYFNRMCVEVCPVIYTESFDETIRYIRSFSLRVKDESVNTLVRPVTVVTSTRNKHHALLEQIPRVGRSTAKKIYNSYDNLTDFVTKWAEAPKRGITKGANWQAVDDFINTTWKVTEAKVIIKKGPEKT